MFGSKRGLLTYLHDVGMAALSFLISLTLRLGQDILVWPREVVVFGLVAFTGVSALVFLSMRLDRTVWRYASMSDLSRIVRAVVLCITLFLAVQFLATRLDDFPRSFLVIEFFVLTLLLAGPRFAYRLVKDGAFSSLFERNAANRVPVLLIGAGDGSDAFIREMGREKDAPYRAVGIVDDRGGRVGRAIRGVPVLGTLKELDEVVAGLRKRDTAPQRLVITRQSIDGAVVRELLDKANELGLAVGRMPRLASLEGAEPGEDAVRSVSVEDLLGRPQKILDRKGVSDLIRGRRVLVTGAGGTIGGELSRQIAALGPAELALMDMGEFPLYQIDLEISETHPALPRRALLTDVRDVEALNACFASFAPDIVFHAAALKHVPLVEANPVDGIMTNVIGTRNVADAVARHGVEAMVLISTDKAVNPTNVMGATKRSAEAYCQAKDREQAEKGGPRYVTVRFGNVLGSTGSVIPLFRRQIARGGPVTVTHPDMTRYFMTVREAVELVLQAAAVDAGLDGTARESGAICVLDMGEPVKIADLARQMIRLSGFTPDKDIAIAFTGPRPGEKLYEELFHDSESLRPTAVEGIRTASPRTADLAVLSRALDEIESAGGQRNAELVLTLLARLVPEFSGRAEGAAGPVAEGAARPA
ncbi:polysaccharide biosynthesis protein [Nisaea sp.]|uniref:polysaccharide biosynthesis protein n=1 Tax=Nisaea sp. TaxID=2024842 RepID=UPI003B51BF1A